MNGTSGGFEPELLVATEDQSFGRAVVDAVERAGVAASAERVEPATGGFIRRDTGGFEGAIVDGEVAEPATVVERLTERAALPVVLLSESSGADDTVARAIEAGATDIFPRTTARAQYELVVNRLVADDSPEGTRPTAEGDTTYQQAYEALFEKISEGLVVHDPETGEIVDVNERFCEMNGYERSELLGESIGMLLTDTNDYGPEAARKRIRRARTEGPQRFEWRNQRRDGEIFPVEVDLTVIELGNTERVLASVQDVTERKRREQEYEQIFNGVNDSITVHDAETGELLDVNDAFCDLVGHDREEIIESGVMEYTPSGQGYTAEEAKEFIREVVETGEPKRTEWAVETADGEIRQLEVTGTTVEIGGDLRYVAIDRDITERKRREQEFEQIFHGVNDGITIHDPDTGEILDANETYLDIFGHDDVETVRELGIGGLSVTEEGYTEERARALINDVAVSEEPRTVEWQIETADGEQRWFESTVAPAEIAGEKRVLAMQRDVTERKRRQREFEQIFNGVQDAIVVLDPDTVEILDANEAFLDMFGYEDIDEVREQGVSGLSVTGEGYTEQRGLEINQRVAESGQPETFEWKNETRSGERIWLGVKVAPAVIGGEQRTIAIHRDVTDRKRREQRLEVFNRILRHNLRNQLDVIQSHAEELADPTTDDHAERIVAAVDELAGIGRRAREVDRILSEDNTLADVDVTQTLRETVETEEPTDSDVSVTTELPEETRLRTDEETVRMAVESALENAFEHAASTVTVAVEDRPDECVITVADDGPGIPEDDLMPIEAQTETRLQHGRGLGLWQLRWCVDHLNGALSFETESGTTVRITVPGRRESGRPD
ncbi:sensor histidine kinase [Natronomonas marina]|uniref:sensor histidine kinase n=1 Tax=Natronomonas marina TaxID=2961939 RepID=UPI0020C9DEEF|nr:PAS domain-containing sensor histidine kinase [Natronomonas marina]